MAALSLLYDHWWVVALVGAVIYLVNKIQVYRRLSAFPGPSTTGFSNIWHTRAMMSLKAEVYNKLCDDYGDFYLSPPLPLHLVTNFHPSGALRIHRSSGSQ